MKAVLVAAAENGQLHQFYRSWSSTRQDLDTLLITGCDTSSASLPGRRVDTVVLDGTLPDDELRAMLDFFQASQPHVVRLVVLPGGKEAEEVTGAHQVLPLRDDMGYLDSVINQCLAVSETLSGNKRLANLISELEKLPSSPMLYFDLRDELSSEQGDLESLSEITGRDPALVAQILKIANSAFYALPRSVSNLEEAIRLLGSDTLLSLVLAAHIFSAMPPPGVKMELLWEHSGQVSALARKIAALQGADRDTQGVCAIAGMLHDIGLLVLLESDPVRYLPLWKQSEGSEVLLAELEKAAYGMTHGELGALVLSLWGLPREIVDAVACSHRWLEPMEPNSDSLVTLSVMTAEWLLSVEEIEGLSAEELPLLLRSQSERVGEWLHLRDGVEALVA